MTPTTEPIIVQAVDRSVVETVAAFVRFRPGFHGDTGIRDYLYHRLMTNPPNGGTYGGRDGRGTLLAQAEWYTALKYRNTGRGPSSGRFDLGIPRPDELDRPKPRPLVAFECGRNKKATDLLRGIEAAKENEVPKPADITKLVRELSFRNLSYGYALEFYDENRGDAEGLIRQLRPRVSSAESDRLRVVVLVCISGGRPALTILPAAWEERIRPMLRAELEQVEGLICASTGGGAPRRALTGGGRGNRVRPEDFLSSCSNEARALIEAVRRRFGSRAKLVFGSRSMTVNRQPNGTLLRIEKAPDSVSDMDPVVSREMAALLHLPILPSYEIGGTQAFREAVIAAVGRALDEYPNGGVTLGVSRIS
jgi:hypothetical protein